MTMNNKVIHLARQASLLAYVYSLMGRGPSFPSTALPKRKKQKTIRNFSPDRERQVLK